MPSENIFGMGAFWQATKSIFHQLWHLSKWLAGHTWDWVAVLFIVTGLWTFGGIVVSAALSSPLPSAIELATGGCFLFLGGLILVARILHAAWVSRELTSIIQRIVINLFVVGVFVLLSVAGWKYLSVKIPVLALSSSELHPLAPSAPQESPATPTVPGAPQTENFAITISATSTKVPAKAEEEAAAEVGISWNGPTAKRVIMDELAASWSVYEDPQTQMAAEDTLWRMLENHETSTPSVPLEIPANNKAVAVPMTLKSIKADQFDLVSGGHSAYYYLCEIRDLEGRVLRQWCFYVDAKNSVRYCRDHNGP